VEEQVEFLVKEKEDLAKEAFEKGDTELGKSFLDAARIFLENANELEKAAEMYEKFGQFTSAVEIWKKLGNDEKIVELESRRKEKIEEVGKNFKEETLSRRFSLFAGLCSFVISIFLFTQNMTGLVVLKAEQSFVNFIGVGFFILALILIYFYVKRNKIFQ
jgi:hypothetical protein